MPRHLHGLAGRVGRPDAVGAERRVERLLVLRGGVESAERGVGGGVLGLAHQRHPAAILRWVSLDLRLGDEVAVGLAVCGQGNVLAVGEQDVRHRGQGVGEVEQRVFDLTEHLGNERVLVALLHEPLDLDADTVREVLPRVGPVATEEVVLELRK